MNQNQSCLEGTVAAGRCRWCQCDVEHDVKLAVVIGSIGIRQGSAVAGLQGPISGICTALSNTMFSCD